MPVDYPGAIDMMLPLNYSFDTLAPLSIVEHQTGGDMTLDAVHQTFLATMRSTHFAVDRDGNVAQFVPLNRGAGGNCCPDPGHDSYWDQFIAKYTNLNFCTISIEHCNNLQNSLPMTPAQVAASNKLNAWLCQRYNLGPAHIKGHSSINPVQKPFCPGSTFDFNQLFSYIQQQGINPHMEQQFTDVWFSSNYAWQNGQKWLSGIEQTCEQAFMAGKIGACYPTMNELKTTDWNGFSIQFQALSNGCHAEWNNQSHVCHIYDAFNRTVI